MEPGLRRCDAALPGRSRMAKQNRSRFACSDQPGPGSEQGSSAESGERNDDRSGSSESSVRDPNLAYLSGNRRTSGAHKLNASCDVYTTAVQRDQQSAVSRSPERFENLPPQKRTRRITKASLFACLRDTLCPSWFKNLRYAAVLMQRVLKGLQAAAYRESWLCRIITINHSES